MTKTIINLQPLTGFLAMHKERSFTVLCRMSTWYKRKLRDQADASDHDLERWQHLLDDTEAQIAFMKKHRTECEQFVDSIRGMHRIV